MSPIGPVPQRAFVYGTFRWLGPPKLPFAKLGGLPPPPSFSPGEPDIAIEILREFGATELVGKVHARILHSSWAPVQIDSLPSQYWFKAYQQYRKHFVFDMRGAGHGKCFISEMKATSRAFTLPSRYAIWSKPLLG